MLSLRSVWQRNFRPSLTVLRELLRDGLQFLNVVVRSRTAVAAEVVFLRKQRAYYPGAPLSVAGKERIWLLFDGWRLMMPFHSKVEAANLCPTQFLRTTADRRA
jgi:hypothetical protein